MVRDIISVRRNFSLTSRLHDIVRVKDPLLGQEILTVIKNMAWLDFRILYLTIHFRGIAAQNVHFQIYPSLHTYIQACDHVNGGGYVYM